MAEKSESVNLCEDVVEGSIFNVTQDDLISTNINESIDNTTHELTIETVGAKAVSYTHLDVYKRQINAN